MCLSLSDISDSMLCSGYKKKWWGCLYRKRGGSLFHPTVHTVGKVFIFYTFTDEFKAFLMRLPQNFYLNSSAIHHLWLLDGTFQRRYELLESNMKGLYRRAQRVVYKLFSLSKRCQKQPVINLPHER